MTYTASEVEIVIVKAVIEAVAIVVAIVVASVIVGHDVEGLAVASSWVCWLLAD